MKTNNITYGLIGAIILCVMFALQWFAKIPLDNMLYKWLPTAIFVLVVILGAMNFSKINEANVTFGQVFGNGFKTTAVITVIFALFFVLFILLFPDYKDVILDSSMAQSANKGATPEQIAQAREMAEKFFLVGGLAGVIFIDLLIGVLASLVGAAIAKKK
ncbi:DUF4199 family protein [Chitinophaga sp. SYP-B3965]|uniref:DUF4199 domain-containing protein n=1 Tax=Chitinophaga sp. SYP-B3965 TaxID=2663120 RepID=UPI0012999A81|nr:DUF4199 domain-containing protein [Chitinophaga sp. SYP-B3965]MRG44062.1 DUF4199 family protein [Chitinophaga sp. SYP-B3965]